MDEFHTIQNNLEKVIENDENTSTHVSVVDVKQTSTIKSDPTIRERLREIINSQKFQIIVILLVVVDCLLVVAELLIDLDVVKLDDKEHHVAPKVLHYLSISVLSLFMIEIGIRMFVMRLEFIKHKLEVFDALIVIVSFILDIVFRDQEGSATGVGLLVVLRLWRVTRIINGIVMSVKAQAQRKVDNEVEKRIACEKENSSLKQENIEQASEILRLKELLKQSVV